ncbi:hypothetical protein ACFLXU_06720 [Chloroflexota bacterium]
MKRILALLLVVILLASGCATGVPQEEYDKVVGDLASAQDQLSTLQSNYDKANDDLANIQGELTELQSDYDETNSALAEAQAKRSAVQNDYSKVKSDLTAVQAEISALESRILALYHARPTTTVEVTKDVEYGRGGDIPLLLDIYSGDAASQSNASYRLYTWGRLQKW